MPIAKITPQGLTAIACSVALLWGVVLSERSLMAKAVVERARVMRSLEQVRAHQNNAAPAKVALPHLTRPVLS